MMKKLNNKGLTIVELLVSVALVSVVMLFLYRMLADVTFQKDNDYFASNNQEQRIEMIDKIERTLSGMTGITGYSLTPDQKEVSINSSAKIVSIKANDDTLKIEEKVGGSSTTKYQWKLKGAVFEENSRIVCESVNTSGYFHKTLVECKIRVSTSNMNNDIKVISGKIIDNNNALDDIEFSFMY